jgi:hypothetical protein
MTIVYDRTKTVVRRHVAPGEAVPLHPEAVGLWNMRAVSLFMRSSGHGQ